MDHQPDHPISHLMQRTLDKGNPNIAILSPIVQLSFVFHIALGILRRQSINENDKIEPIVIVMASCSQSEFQQAITEENDTFLLNDGSDAQRLNQIQFRFCLDFDQLITLLCDLCQPISASSSNLTVEKRPVALIIIDLANYLELLSTNAPTLADLTRLLGFISATQSTLTSQNQKETRVAPIYLIDRIKHSQKWPLSNSNLEETRSIEKIYRHFFGNTWNIETVENSLPCLSDEHTRRYRLYPISCEDSSTVNNQDIMYQVCEESRPEHEYSIHNIINGPYRRTHVLPEPTC